jgi:hypothetical protein
MDQDPKFEIQAKISELREDELVSSLREFFHSSATHARHMCKGDIGIVLVGRTDGATHVMDDPEKLLKMLAICSECSFRAWMTKPFIKQECESISPTLFNKLLSEKGVYCLHKAIHGN